MGSSTYMAHKLELTYYSELFVLLTYGNTLVTS